VSAEGHPGGQYADPRTGGGAAAHIPSNDAWANYYANAAREQPAGEGAPPAGSDLNAPR